VSHAYLWFDAEVKVAGLPPHSWHVRDKVPGKSHEKENDCVPRAWPRRHFQRCTSEAKSIPQEPCKTPARTPQEPRGHRTLSFWGQGATSHGSRFSRRISGPPLPSLCAARLFTVRRATWDTRMEFEFRDCFSLRALKPMKSQIQFQFSSVYFVQPILTN